VIEFRGVSFRYTGVSDWVLRDISFLIPGTGVTAIMGANGSGKSTAALCMNGVLNPERGDILVDGINTREGSRVHEIRRSVGVVFQDPHLQFTSLTVEREIAFGLENINVNPKEMRRRVDSVLSTFGLGHLRDELPGSLSGGEKQRLALAAVAVLDPRYLVLDEATTLLSPVSRRSILMLAREDAERRDGALVVITQFPGEAKQASHLIVFHNGDVAYGGPPSRLHESPEDFVSLGVPVALRERLGWDGH